MCRGGAAHHAPEFFSAQLSDPANSACCDGGSGEAEWASVSHGIYLSIAAAGVHRSMGVRTSFVQSTAMDAWKPIHLRMMELGGNRRFNDFLRQHGIPEDMPIREKYATRAAAWYRRNLLAEAEGTEAPKPLPEGTAHLPEQEALATDAILDRVFAEARADASPRSVKSAPDLSSSRTPRAPVRKQSSRSLPDLDATPVAAGSMSKLVCDGLTYAIRLAKLGGAGTASARGRAGRLDRTPGRGAPLPSLLTCKPEASPAAGVPGRSAKVLTFAPGC